MIVKKSSFLISKKSGILNLKNSKNGQLRFPRFRAFSKLKVNTLESFLILFSINSYYFRLIHGLIASFLAFCSDLGSWLMASSSLVARRSAPVPFPGLCPLLAGLFPALDSRSVPKPCDDALSSSNRPLLGSNGHLGGGVAQPQKTRKPNLATFGQIIYYISSRILKNHSVESWKDVIT